MLRAGRCPPVRKKRPPPRRCPVPRSACAALLPISAPPPRAGPGGRPGPPSHRPPAGPDLRLDPDPAPSPPWGWAGGAASARGSVGARRVALGLGMSPRRVGGIPAGQQPDFGWAEDRCPTNASPSSPTVWRWAESGKGIWCAAAGSLPPGLTGPRRGG